MTSDIGLELASEHAGKLTSSIQVTGNTFIKNHQTGLFLGGYASSGTGGTKGCTITGNTFYQNDTLQWGNGEVQLRYRTSNCVLKNNVIYGGAGNYLVTVPVSAANNVNNVLDDNTYYAAAGANKTLWIWNNKQVTGFAAWKTVSGQDADSQFAQTPPSVSTELP